MSDELKEVREVFESDMTDWSDAREARAKCMKALAGDPWPQNDRQARTEAGRPCLTYDELSQHTNQVVNDFRANPLSVEFAPGPPLFADQQLIEATEEAAELYGDAFREMDYRCNGPEVFTTAAENAVQGGYGFAGLKSEFIPGTFEQRLALRSFPDPNTVVPNWDFQSPDLCDMRRCFVLEERSIAQFKKDFPKATVTSFDSYLRDDSYKRWVKDGKIQLAEYWQVLRDPVTLLLVQVPGLPMPITVKKADWPRFRVIKGAKVLKEREDTEPRVIQQLVNGVEILKETPWPGPYIPIAGCMGRILYTDDGGTSKRLLMSAVQLALEPYLAYCVYRTSELETAMMVTKNPYWAYANQLDQAQQNEIAKSLHEPVAVLTANATTPETGTQILPLPIRNPQSADLSSFSLGAEESRRAILSALGEAALPTSAQRQNEKSKVALDKIEQSRQKGTYHFFDHYKGMVCHMGRLFEAAFDTFHDTKRQIAARKRDETIQRVWINDPQNQDAINVRGNYSVTVSAGPHVDSTREAASQFADTLIASPELMQMLGPQKAQKLTGLAVKLKVKQTGIGAIGEEMVNIIDPEDSQALDAQALLQHVKQADQLLEMAKQRIAELENEQAGKMALEQQKGAVQLEKARMDNEVKLAVAELGAKIERLSLFYEERARVGAEIHDAAMAAADAGHEQQQADKQMLAAMAQPPTDVAGTGASAA